MRSSSEVVEVLSLVAQGLNDCEVARRTGVPRSTVRGWRRGERRSIDAPGPTCEVCGHRAHDPELLPQYAYAYLLGLYLGDGSISSAQRGVYRLRIALDRRYPGILDECAAAIHQVSGKDTARVPAPGCFQMSAYWKSWPCLFPQHGPGVKHLRPIVLDRWQQRLVDREPGALLRGLIHSDGWRGVNRVTVNGKRYEYPRYNFCNRSDDIRRIFCDACESVGVQWRQMNRWNISVARRESVLILDDLVGPKR